MLTSCCLPPIAACTSSRLCLGPGTGPMYCIYETDAPWLYGQICSFVNHSMVALARVLQHCSFICQNTYRVHAHVC